MRYRTFVIYNIVGGILWGTSVTVGGYFLGQLPVVANNIEVILVGIVAVSFIPVVIELFRARRRRASEPPQRSTNDAPRT